MTSRGPEHPTTVRPNIVFIQADQLAARQLGCYGGGLDSSPTLDRLAGEGMRFDRCYTSFPISLPNRASTLTGRTPGIHGLINGRTRLLDDHPCYAQCLRDVGYRIGGFGKFHREGTSSPHPRRLDDLGFDEALIVEDDKRGPYLDWIQTHHPEWYELALGRLGKCMGMLTPEQRKMREHARETVFRPLFAQEQYVHMFPSPFPAEVHDSTWITDHGIDFMQRHTVAHPDTPFFCQISYVDPHDPYDPPAPYSDLYSADDVPPPLPIEWQSQGPACMDTYNALNCRVIRNENPAIFRRAKALYHGSVRFVDDQIGRIIRHLEESELSGNTVVVFTTDHGDMIGDHGCLAKGFVHYDGSVRCPLIAWGAGVGSGTADSLQCALDFFPTFCDLAGVPSEALPPLEGRSFAPALEAGDNAGTGHQEVAIWYDGVQSVVTDDGWRLTRFLEHGEGQMFHLQADQDEQHNLYASAAHAEVRQCLLERALAAAARPFAIPRYANLAPGKRS
jgi:arylsulfatase A-like enzyme